MDTQTLAVLPILVAAAAYLAWRLVPRRVARPGCGSCPHDCPPQH